MSEVITESNTQTASIGPQKLNVRVGWTGVFSTDTQNLYFPIPPDPKFTAIQTIKGVCGGEPTLAETRITVRTLYSLFRQGETKEGLMRAFNLVDWQVEAALEYAERHKEEIMRLIDENAKA